MNDAGPGRREENKRRTHHALVREATRLFREQGYEATTVRDIARAAGVGERTFFRYFPSKESLILQQVRDLIPKLVAEIRIRPAAEPPLAALREAILELARRYDALPAILLVGPYPLTADPTSRGDRLLLLDLEEAISAAFLDRLALAQSDPDTGAVLRAAVLARAGVGVLRVVRLTYHEMSDAQREGLNLADLLHRAFAALAPDVR
ncbi:TetR/AcrR family transcriptional regulator [Kitasatospora sp. GAS204B]|uniref:TetR/AcrR family transcriptional regulator n=1 Tax=unclassified Kitasatospora TaxID=2633591 RepID=UPI002474E16C|nr:TetR/AcrR family transcriptional regulator [Kitasatospora sp. GAS204B]MDH6118458.1 AcrR family transcriptional regulator [Kitasatospora sp. GAS204B]